MVSEKIRKGAAPMIMAAQPAPPPRSTPLQTQLVSQQQLRQAATSPPPLSTSPPPSPPPLSASPLPLSTSPPPPSPSQKDGGEWLPANNGEISADSYSPVFNGATHNTTGSPNCSQDCPAFIPDFGTDSLDMPSLPVKSDDSYTSTVDDQIIAQGHARDSSDICETSFDDVTSSTFHTPPSGESGQESHVLQEDNNLITTLEKTSNLPDDATGEPPTSFNDVTSSTFTTAPKDEKGEGSSCHYPQEAIPPLEHTSNLPDSAPPTSFNDVTSSTFHPSPNGGNNDSVSSSRHRQEAITPLQKAANNVPDDGTMDKPEPQPHQVDSSQVSSVTTKQEKVPPPVPQRRSSALVTHHTPTHTATKTSETESSSGAHFNREMRRIPSLKERKKQLEANVAASSSPAQGQPVEHVLPGKLVIQEAVRCVSAGLPADQHPLLRKKQEEMAARDREAREREERERERLPKEAREKEEKTKKRLSLLRRRGKAEVTKSETVVKEQNRRSMTASEKEELQRSFKQLTRQKSSTSDGPDPPSLPQSPTGSDPPSLPPSTTESNTHSLPLSNADSDPPSVRPLSNPPSFPQSSAVSNAPSLSPSSAVSNAPSLSPSSAVSNAPSLSPSSAVSNAPSLSPSSAVSNAPSLSPSSAVSNAPSLSPSSAVSNAPPLSPSSAVSNAPSLSPCAEEQSVANEEALVREKEMKEWEEREAEEVCKRGLPPQPQQAQNTSTPDPAPTVTSPQLSSVPENPEELQHSSHTVDASTGSQSNTLERCTLQPPSSSPPSLPGSIDRKALRQPNSRSSTLERSRPCSRPGSQPGTLERKSLPRPTSQPPPIPGDGRKEQSKTRTGSVGFTGRRMELVDLIPGVSPQILTVQPGDTSTSTKGGRAINVAGRPINVKRKSTVKKRH